MTQDKFDFHYHLNQAYFYITSGVALAASDKIERDELVEFAIIKSDNPDIPEIYRQIDSEQASIYDYTEERRLITDHILTVEQFYEYREKNRLDYIDKMNTFNIARTKFKHYHDAKKLLIEGKVTDPLLAFLTT